MTSLTATITPLENLNKAADLWSKVGASFEVPFFLSWDWIAAAAASASGQLFLAKFHNEQSGLVGGALFCQVTEKRSGFVSSRQLRLHEFGQSAAETIVNEYNTILIDPSLEKAAWQALLKALAANTAPSWDEVIVVNAVSTTEEMLNQLGAKIHRRAENQSGWVDLTSLRKNGADSMDGYLAGLSRNTRGQIKRALRLYAERGPVKISRAQTKEEAYVYLDSLAQLHEQKWAARGTSGGFISQQHYLKFHRQMIEQCFDKGHVELLRASAGDNAFGWLHNYIDNGRILFNAGGFQTEADNKLKPGLVTQALAIELHLQEGANAYDFLAGGDRYKYSMGQIGPETTSFAIQNNSLPLKAERFARHIKQRLEAISQ